MNNGCCGFGQVKNTFKRHKSCVRSILKNIRSSRTYVLFITFEECITQEVIEETLPQWLFYMYRVKQIRKGIFSNDKRRIAISYKPTSIF